MRRCGVVVVRYEEGASGEYEMECLKIQRKQDTIILLKLWEWEACFRSSVTSTNGKNPLHLMRRPSSGSGQRGSADQTVEVIGQIAGKRRFTGAGKEFKRWTG